ncbi:uncharacterized protein [Macrobrachium rosenbergii]|uniref:uncharacterized protein isoform X2 n=1 Tax=Macrobrachium rosenbergii TaxID=79674 RepID=UPI0034D74E27
MFMLMEKSGSSQFKMNEKLQCTKRLNRKFWDNFLHKRQSEEAVKVQQPFEGDEIDNGWTSAEKYDASDSGLSDSGSSPEPSTSNIGRGSTLVSGSSTDIASNAVGLLPDRPHDLEAVLPSLTQTASSDLCSSLNEEDAPGPFKRLVSCLAVTRPDYSFHQLFESLDAVRQHPSVLTYHTIQRFCQPSSKRSVSSTSLHNTLSQEEPIDYSAKEKTPFSFRTEEELRAPSVGPSRSSESQELPVQASLNSRFDIGAERDSERSSIAAETLNSLQEEECLQSYKNNHNLMSVIEEPGIGLTEDQEIALFTHILKHSKQEVTTEDSQVVMDIVQKSFSKKSIPVQEMSNMPIVGKGLKDAEKKGPSVCQRIGLIHMNPQFWVPRQQSLLARENQPQICSLGHLCPLVRVDPEVKKGPFQNLRRTTSTLREEDVTTWQPKNPEIIERNGRT